MLKLCNSVDREALENFCNVSDPFASYVLCRAKAYGFEKRFCETWLCFSANKVTSALSVINGNAVLYSNGDTDFEELGSFINSARFNTLLTDAFSAEMLGFASFRKKQALIFSADAPKAELLSAADYKQVYSLLCECFPHEYLREKEHYLEWLSDITFRSGRKLARVRSVFDGGELCSNALTVAETDITAVIGGVCCKAEKRGLGFGKKAVFSIASELLNEKKNVFVLANDDVAEGFYKKIGFSLYENSAYIERNNNV